MPKPAAANEPPAPVEAPVATPPTNHRFLIILLVILVIIGFSAASLLVGYLIADRRQPDFPTPTPIASPQPSSGGGSPSPFVSPQPSGVVGSPTLAPNPKGNTYQSSKLGIAFYYASKMPGTNETIKVAEVDNRIYVYPQSQNQEAGQSVEVFTKAADQSLNDAIKQQFLSGISSADCFVAPVDSAKPNIEKAIIDYPVPANADLPFYEYGTQCPAKYSKTNGIRYFYYDPAMPTKFFFFSLGQYGIPAASDSKETLWSDTLTPTP